MGVAVTLSPTALRSSLFGDNSGYMSGYLQQQMDIMQNTYGNYGGELMNNSLYNSLQQSYDVITNSLRTHSINQELSMANMKIVDDYFDRLTTFEEIQQANGTMQRFIMAQPDLRQAWLNKECDGYSDSYIDIDPGSVGDDHYDYRRVMDGVTQIDENGDSYFMIYDEDLYEGDTDLDFEAQCKILDTWSAIKNIMDTSTYDMTKNSTSPQHMFK